MTITLRKPILALALLGAVALGGCDDDPAAPSSTAQLRVVHASPDAPDVDVIVDGAPALTNVPFGAASPDLNVPAGTRELQVRAAGTNTTVIDPDASLTAGAAYTVLATGLVADIAPLVLEGDLTAPPSGNAKVRLVHAAPSAGTVDIYVTTPTADLATATPTLAAVPFRAASDYLPVPPGTYRVRVTPTGTTTVAIDVTATRAAGRIRTAVAVDADGGGAPFSALLLADRS